jgi:hypothetical protein
MMPCRSCLLLLPMEQSSCRPASLPLLLLRWCGLMSACAPSS